MLASTRRCCAGGASIRSSQTPLWQKAAAILVWILIWQFAAMGLGHGGLFLATPLQTLGALAQLAPTAAFWQRIVFSALRIMAGFLLAAAGGLLLGAVGARWHWVRVFIDPAMQLIRAMPVASFVILALLWVRSANLSVIVSFTHVLPVVYAGVLGGIADTDQKLLEMAKVYRLPLTARLRYIWLPGIFPSFCESCIAAMGMCWKSGVSAEVIGLPDHSVGDALYRAKITLSTPDVFAWTLVIVLLSAALSAAAAACCARPRHVFAGRCACEHCDNRSLQKLRQYAGFAALYLDGGPPHGAGGPLRLRQDHAAAHPAGTGVRGLRHSDRRRNARRRLSGGSPLPAADRRRQPDADRPRPDAAGCRA